MGNNLEAKKNNLPFPKMAYSVYLLHICFAMEDSHHIRALNIPSSSTESSWLR